MQDSRAGGLINPITLRKIVQFVRTERFMHLITTLSRVSRSARAQVAATSTQGRNNTTNLKLEGVSARAGPNVYLIGTMCKERDRRLAQPVAKKSLMRQHGVRKTDHVDRIREVDEPRGAWVSFILVKSRYAESFLQRLARLKKISACDATALDVMA